MANEKSQGSGSNDHVSYWQVFMDDWWLLFFLAAAILFISYTTWGVIELASVGTSPLEGLTSTASTTAPAAAATSTAAPAAVTPPPAAQ
ncbi:MAG: hypothetical protein EPO63_08460 [Candidatus Nitrosotenuis sp.]|nr:MAG: hypothetical protein EPO63_08460 [Candidatus Nitrosotenuis sp.]